MSSSWEARTGCRGLGDGCPLPPRDKAMGVLGAYRGSPAMESPGLPSEGSRSSPAVSLPARRKGEKTGKEGGMGGGK